MREINAKPGKWYVILILAAFCTGFLVRHLLAVREKNIELSERAENRKYMEQVLKENEERSDKSIDDYLRATANLK